MHISAVTLLLSIWLITTTFGQQNIRFAFFYPFDSPEISHPLDGTYNITEVLDYGIQLFERSPLGSNYDLSYISYDTNCTAREGNRAYIEMLQEPNDFPFIIGELVGLYSTRPEYLYKLNLCHKWLMTKTLQIYRNNTTSNI